MTNLHVEIPTPRIDNPTIQAAVRTICANARDTTEAKAVMEMCGIIGYERTNPLRGLKYGNRPDWVPPEYPARTTDAMNQPGRGGTR